MHFKCVCEFLLCFAKVITLLKSIVHCAHIFEVVASGVGTMKWKNHISTIEFLFVVNEDDHIR
jgi:hypothetical protein